MKRKWKERCQCCVYWLCALAAAWALTALFVKVGPASLVDGITPWSGVLAIGFLAVFASLMLAFLIAAIAYFMAPDEKEERNEN